MDQLAGNVFLVVGAPFLAIFVGWVMNDSLTEVSAGAPDARWLNGSDSFPGSAAALGEGEGLDVRSLRQHVEGTDARGAVAARREPIEVAGEGCGIAG